MSRVLAMQDAKKGEKLRARVDTALRAFGALDDFTTATDSAALLRTSKRFLELAEQDGDQCLPGI